MIVPRYAPGRWQAVVTDGHICLLPPEVDPDTVVALWTAVREGAGLTAQLQLLLAGGLDALPPFALVALERERVHVVVRGDVEVHVDGDEPRTVRGRRVATWHEDVVDRAGGVVVRVLDAGSAADARLPVLSAVVAADAVAVELRSGTSGTAPGSGAAEPVAAPEPALAPAAPTPSVVERSPEPAAEPVVERVPEPVAAPEPAGGSAPEPEREREPAVEPQPEPEPEPEAEPEAEPVTRPTWAPVQQPRQAAQEEGPAPSDDAPDRPAAASPEVPVAVAAAPTTADGLDDLEHTVLHAATDTSVGLPLAEVAEGLRGAVPAPAPPPSHESLPEAAPAPAVEDEAAPATVPPATPAAPDAPAAPDDVAAPDDADHDGTTVLSTDVVALRRALPDWAGDGIPGPLAVPAADRPAPAKIRLSSGLVVSLTRPVLLGRAPQVSRVSNREMPRLVTVASPRQDISRTHAEVRMDGDDVLVTDLRSTNGVLLLRQGHGPQRLHPGEPTVVEPGVSVDLGEGVTFVVERGA